MLPERPSHETDHVARAPDLACLEFGHGFSSGAIDAAACVFDVVGWLLFPACRSAIALGLEPYGQIPTLICNDADYRRKR